jgi:hypothetical protein
MILKLCYTLIRMQTDSRSVMHSSWPRWSEFLHHRGLENLAAWALEAAGPLTILGAQVLYLGGPFFRPALTDAQCNALADLLEDREEALAFAAFLREEPSL